MILDVFSFCSPVFLGGCGLATPLNDKLGFLSCLSRTLHHTLHALTHTSIGNSGEGYDLIPLTKSLSLLIDHSGKHNRVEVN